MGFRLAGVTSNADGALVFPCTRHEISMRQQGSLPGRLSSRLCDVSQLWVSGSVGFRLAGLTSYADRALVFPCTCNEICV